MCLMNYYSTQENLITTVEAMGESDEELDDMGGDPKLMDIEDDELDNLPLTLHALISSGSISILCTPAKTSGVQTGGLQGVGHIVSVEKPVLVDAGTLVYQKDITLPLLLSVNTDSGLMDLRLNYLTQANI